MSKLSTVLGECLQRELEDGRPSVHDIVACAYDHHRDVFDDESERLVWKAAENLVKHMLNSLSNDELSNEQLSLPGLHFPSVITVRDEESIYLVRSDKAVWSEIVAGMQERVDNVSAAEAKLQIYRDSMDIVRPVMESDPACTVADAIRRMDGAA